MMLDMQGKIDRITIKGFKSIRELVDFELTNLNVVVGANGAGKSNFIQILRMVNAMSMKGFQQFIVNAGGADAFPFNGIKETPRIDIGFTFGQNSYQFSLTPTVDEKFSIAEAWMCGGVEQRDEEGLLESRLLEGDSIPRWTVYHFHDTSPNASMRRSEIVEDCERLRSDGGNIAPFLSTLR